MKNICLFSGIIVLLIIIIFNFACIYKPIITELPSGKKIKELGFQDFFIIGKDERNFIYEYKTEINIDNEEEIKKEAKEIFCLLRSKMDFKKYNLITIKSTIILKRNLIFYVKAGKINSFKANEEPCD